MNDDDFEARLKALLNESVDRRTTGATRVAPPFTPPRRTDGKGAVRRAGRWLLPLATAACIAAIVGGAVAVRDLGGPDHHPSPPVVVPTTAPAPSPTGAVSTAPITKAPATKVPARKTPTPRSTTRPATTVTVRLGRATIALPTGWHAFLAKGDANQLINDEQSWCLAPRSAPAGTATGSCPLNFAPQVDGLMLDADTQGGVQSDPEYCFQGSEVAGDVGQGRLTDFGGRDAVYYQRNVRCTRQSTHVVGTDFVQYDVLGDPSYILFASHPTSAVRSAMSYIVARSHLPQQTSTLWRADVGRITALTRDGSAVHLTLARAYRRSDPRTSTKPYALLGGSPVRYTVTSQQLDTGGIDGALKVGSYVLVTTDGSKVTQINGLYDQR